MLTLAVLGTVKVTRDGWPVSVPGGKTTEVLIRLALDAGEPVRADRIIHDLWAAPAVGTARNTLQVRVSQLRHALGSPDVITGSHGGYTLMVAVEQVDALRVTSVAAAARASLRYDCAAAALEQTAEGLALFGGDILADAGDGDWLGPHRARLEEIRLGLLEDQNAARVELGADGGVIGDLETLVALYPTREGLWSSLITALYRNGRQAEALAAYGRVRELLATELGLDPGPQLRSLEAQVLAHSLAPTTKHEAPQPASLPDNLPRRSTTLVGRDTDLRTVRTRLRQQQLITLVGPAGVGKTRLAIEAARDLVPPGGNWLIRLDEFDPETTPSIAQMVAETMHIADAAVLAQRLASVETTIIFDNCEHVIAEVATLINSLLNAAPRLRVLATSQVPLGLDGEDVYSLEPLSAADSIELFTARALSATARFVLDTNTRLAVEQVCQSLDGLPLAIELAAARVKSLSVPEISRRLPDRFALLQDPTSRQPLRRRALGAAIAWSYDLLFPDDQHGLWALSCFAGSAPLAGAEYVLQELGVPAPAAVDVIARLVDRSLVSVTVKSDGAVSYRLLDSIRAYAVARMRESGSADAALGAHAQWFAEKADWCAATVRGPGQSECVAFTRDQRANVDAALAWAARNAPSLGLRIANGFGWTWVVVGDGVAGAARIRRALNAAAADGLPQHRIQAQLTTSWLEASAGNLSQAQQDLNEAATAIAQIKDEVQLAEQQRTEAFLRLQQGRPPEAAQSAERAIAGYQQHQHAWGQGGTLLLAAYAAMMLGATPQAYEQVNAALALLRPLGDPWTLVHAEAILGAIARGDRHFDAAALHLNRAAEISHRLGLAGQEAYHLTTLGRTQQQQGNLTQSAATLERAVTTASGCGDLRMAATARLNLSRVRRATGHPAAAAELLQRNSVWYQTAGGGDGALLTESLLAAGPPARLPDLHAVLAQAELTGNAEVQVLTLDALALAAAQTGAPRTAEELLNRADQLATTIAHSIGDSDRIEGTQVRSMLGTVAGHH